MYSRVLVETIGIHSPKNYTAEEFHMLNILDIMYGILFYNIIFLNKNSDSAIDN